MGGSEGHQGRRSEHLPPEPVPVCWRPQELGDGVPATKEDHSNGGAQASGPWPGEGSPVMMAGGHQHLPGAPPPGTGPHVAQEPLRTILRSWQTGIHTPTSQMEKTCYPHGSGPFAQRLPSHLTSTPLPVLARPAEHLRVLLSASALWFLSPGCPPSIMARPLY